MEYGKLKKWQKEVKRFTDLQQEDERFREVIELVAPGTPLRIGIDFIVQAQLGGLIVLGVPKNKKIIEVGFEVNKDFSPTKLYEISKMDGAIILNKKAGKILYNNVHLHPNTNIQSDETGTRHKVSERFAKQTGLPVIAISKKRNVVTVFTGNTKYILKYIPELLAEATQAVSMYEHYSVIFGNTMDNITTLELNGTVVLADIVNAIIRYFNSKKMLRVIGRKIAELGAAGNILKLRMQEINQDLREGQYLIRDYITPEAERHEKDIIRTLEMFSEFNYLEPLNVAAVMGYPESQFAMEQRLDSRGYRLLSRVPRLTENSVNQIIKNFGSFAKIIAASGKEIAQTSGVSEASANNLKEYLLNMRTK